MIESSNERYVLEVGGRSVGLLVSDQNHYTFFAATKAALALDRKEFASPEAAQRAVDSLVRPKLKRS